MQKLNVPRSRQPRVIRLIHPLDHHGVGAFYIKTDRGFAFYTIREIPCEIGGRGFVVHLMGLGTLYHVRVGVPNDCTCECKGFLYRSYCRHTLGLEALIAQGKL